uniref:Transposase n=1 Tax=Denticeps clupeoides TaxID=299321 RepID=A0AAY4D9A2_9TELE
MPRSKEIQEQRRTKVIEIYQSCKGYKAISKALGLQRTTVRAIILKWQKHGTVVNLPRSGRPTKITPRAQRQLIREATKDSRTTSKELQASLASIKVSVHDSTIRKRLGKNGLHGRFPRRKPQKNISVIAKTFGKIPCGPTRLKLIFFGRCVSRYIWRKSNTAFQKKNIIPTVKYGGGSVMVRSCFAASGPERLAVIDGTLNSTVYQKILKENVRPSVRQLKLKQSWVLQQDNDPKHTSKSTSEWLKKNQILEWSSQSPDLNPNEMLWHDLKKAVHARKPSNKAELQQFCKDEWAKIPPELCKRLVASYCKRLIAVIAAKGGPPSY